MERKRKNKKKLQLVSMMLLLCMCFAWGNISRAEEITRKIPAEEMKLEAYYYDEEYGGDYLPLDFENTVIVNRIVYQYHEETDSFEAVAVDVKDPTLPKVLHVVFEEYIYGRPVTKVNLELMEFINYDYEGCTIRSITYPKTMNTGVYLDYEYGGESLRKLVFAGNMDYIEASGDPGGDTALRTVIIKEPIKTSGYFYGNENLKEVELPKTLKTVERIAFSDCKSLKELILPKGTLSIGEQAFEGCKKLMLYVPPSVKKIGKNAFGNSKTGKIKKLYCVKNSKAHKYAKKNKIPYELVNSKLSKRKITGLTPKKKQITMKVGETRQLQITVTPFYAKGQKLTYQSKKPAVAEVSEDGVVTALKEGKTVLTIKAKSGVKTKVEITVGICDKNGA